MQPLRRARPPTARELESREGFRTSQPGLILERPAWVRGRHDTGAVCPSCNLAQEAATATTTNPILALDLGKNKSIACFYRGADDHHFCSFPRVSSAHSERIAQFI